MREMKDSGQTWLGAIPAKWDQSTIGSLYTLRNEKVSDRDYPPLSVTMKGVVPQLDTAAKTDSHDDRKLVKKGDFAINSRSDRRGSCGISSYDGSVSLINTILTPRDEMNPDYYNWVFHTSQFADEFYRWGHGIVDDLWTTRWQEMKNIVVAVPSLDEQEIIAETISSEVTKVNVLIANQETQIEKLKQYKQSIITEVVTKGLDPDTPMKDSEIEWIGSIPSSWKLSKIRYVGEPQNGISKGGEFFGSGYPFVSYGDVYKNFELPEMVAGLVESSNDEREVYSVRYGDIFFTRTSETIEEVGFTAVCLKTIPDATFAGFLIRLRPYQADSKILTRFAKYYFRGNHIREYLVKEMNLVTRASLGQTLLKAMAVLVPPKDEQEAIAEYLDKKCEQIDRLISIKEKKIEKMELYRKSIIYEYVTGKKKVI